MKAYRDIKNSIDTAVKRGSDEGLAEGLEKGCAEGLELAARNMLRIGMTPEQVSAATGIDSSKLRNLTNQ